MGQEELILGRLIAKDPYTALVIHDTDPNGVNVLGINPVYMEGGDYIAIEMWAGMPEERCVD